MNPGGVVTVVVDEVVVELVVVDDGASVVVEVATVVEVEVDTFEAVSSPLQAAATKTMAMASFHTGRV